MLQDSLICQVRTHLGAIIPTLLLSHHSPLYTLADCIPGLRSFDIGGIEILGVDVIQRLCCHFVHVREQSYDGNMRKKPKSHEKQNSP